MRRVWIVLLLALSPLAPAQQPVPLHNGQQLVLHGTLTMEPAGRLQYVTVKTSSAYQPVFQTGHGTQQPGEILHEIGLAGYRDYALLYANRGKPVTVSGKVSTDDATPYFWHGTRLEVSSIRLADGRELLHPAPPAPTVAVDTGTYRAKAVLPADLAAPWRYSFEGRADPQGLFLSCSSNGGGDVVNCFCAEHFHPVTADGEAKGARVRGRVFDDMRTAQFDVGDDARVVELTVTCSR